MENHKNRLEKRIEESSTTIWNAWSTQAVELQMFRADHKNRQKTGKWFYRMDEQSINTMREDLTKNFYTLAQSHSDEIRKLLEKFDDD